MTPLYDVLSAQPSLDAGQIQRKKFKLAMSVGKKRHYALNDIVPRHFVQTAEIAGIGSSMIRTLFADIAASALSQTSAVIDALPHGFPQDMTESIYNGVVHRVRLIDTFLTGDLNPDDG